MLGYVRTTWRQKPEGEPDGTTLPQTRANAEDKRKSGNSRNQLRGDGLLVGCLRSQTVSTDRTC